jgi:hypothetical protein
MPLANDKHFSSIEIFFAAGEDCGSKELASDIRVRYEERVLELLPYLEATWLDRGRHLVIA